MIYATDLVEEGLAYFEKSGDAGDKEYVKAIRQHIAHLSAQAEVRVTPRRMTINDAPEGIEDLTAGEAWADGYNTAMDTRLSQGAQGEASSVWVVCDETGQPGFCASWPEVCHEHINDAINEHGIEEAKSWTVRRYTHPAERAAVPDGWVLVPREPTAEMMSAARKIASNRFQIQRAWDAMLTAAPQPPEGARVVDDKDHQDAKRANEDKGGEAVALVRVKYGGYSMELARHVAYRLPDGDHWLYTSPRATAEDVRDAQRYRLLRDAKDTKGFWIAYGEYGRMSRWNGEPADKAIDQALAAELGEA